ncbi:MAG: response regulator [Anaerolineae bacterium]
MTATEAFVQQVQDALSHLYDYAYLQNHPLRECLAGGGVITDRERMRLLRTTLLQAIEDLNPGATVPFRSASGRAYHVLNLHYVEGSTIEQVARELAISERQVYRDLRKAERDLAGVVWELLRSLPPSPALSDRTAERAELVRREAERIGSDPEQVPLGALVDSALQALTPLGEQRGVILDASGTNDVSVLTDRLLARQALMSALSGAIQDAEPGSRVCARVGLIGKQVQVQIRYGRNPATRHDEVSTVAVQQLVQRLGGRWYCSDGTDAAREIRFTLGAPSYTTLLVIDDNQGLAELFSRYLESLGIEILSAQDGREGLRLAIEQAPDLIVLDVMMPKWDGWEVLQWLRDRVESRNIPVVVCSVLDDPQLALSLGAAAFLPKPVNRARLLQTVRELLPNRQGLTRC